MKISKRLKRSVCTVALLFLLFTTLLPAIVVQPANAFRDIPYGHQYFDSLSHLKESGYISGYTDGFFRPWKVVNRVEALKMIFSAANIHVDSHDTQFHSLFSDISKGAWYIPYVKKAREYRIITGYDDGTFQPGNELNRAEFLKVFLKAYAIDEEMIDELNLKVNYKNTRGTWFEKYARFAYAAKLFEADKKGNLRPEKKVSRGEVAEAIFRLMNYIQENKRFIIDDDIEEVLMEKSKDEMIVGKF